MRLITWGEPGEIARRVHSYERWAVLYGRHSQLVEVRMRETLGTTRKDFIGAPDLSLNLLSQVSRWMAVSYQSPPVITHAKDEAAAAEMAALCDAMGLWSLMRRVNRDTIGLRDCLVRVGVNGAGRPYARIAWPHHIEAEPWPGEPDTPMLVKEAREAWVQGQCIQYREVHGLRREGDRIVGYRYCEHIEPGQGDAEALSRSLGMDTATYPYIDDRGDAVLPYAWYHAGHPCGLWDTWEWIDIFDATLTVCVLRSMYTHALRQASWAQRWLINGQPAGASAGVNGELALTPDPTMVLTIEATALAAENGLTPQAGQWQAPQNLQDLLGSIRSYSHDALQAAGLPAAEVLRTGADPRSGLSLAVSREAQREVQAEYVPQFEAGDRQLLQLVAICAGISGVASLPIDMGWRTKHQTLGLSTDEMLKRASYTQTATTQRLISRAEAYMLHHPGVTMQQAEERADELAADTEQSETTEQAPMTVEQLAAVLAKAAPGLLEEGKTYEAIAAAREAAAMQQQQQALDQQGDTP